MNELLSVGNHSNSISPQNIGTELHLLTSLFKRTKDNLDPPVVVESNIKKVEGIKDKLTNFQTKKLTKEQLETTSKMFSDFLSENGTINKDSQYKYYQSPFYNLVSCLQDEITNAIKIQRIIENIDQMISMLQSNTDNKSELLSSSLQLLLEAWQYRSTTMDAMLKLVKVLCELDISGLHIDEELVIKIQNFFSPLDYVSNIIDRETHFDLMEKAKKLKEKIEYGNLRSLLVQQNQKLHDELQPLTCENDLTQTINRLQLAWANPLIPVPAAEVIALLTSLNEIKWDSLSFKFKDPQKILTELFSLDTNYNISCKTIEPLNDQTIRRLLQTLIENYKKTLNKDIQRIKDIMEKLKPGSSIDSTTFFSLVDALKRECQNLRPESSLDTILECMQLLKNDLNISNLKSLPNIDLVNPINELIEIIIRIELKEENRRKIVSLYDLTMELKGKIERASIT